MIIQTKQFRDVASTILLAVDTCNAFSTNLELAARENFLYLSVTNKEYFVAVKFPIEDNTGFKAVVEAPLFLNLISGITTDTFILEDLGSTVAIKVGKSSYKLPKIYENDDLLKLPVITIGNKTVEMNISNDILKSIVNINGKEVAKAKNLDVSELQKLYYITNEGCFTFTSGACLNNFTLEKPIRLLLNERIVKLFKLFKDDVHFTFGQDLAFGKEQTKVSFETSDIYLAAIIENSSVLLDKVSRPCEMTRNMINEHYDNVLVLPANALASAIARLMLFAKNSDSKVSTTTIKATFSINENELTIADNNENIECLQLDNNSYSNDPYVMSLYLNDLKMVLDSCKDEHITINCGNHQSVVITRGTVSNLIPEADD